MYQWYIEKRIFTYRYFSIVSWRCFANRTGWIPKPSYSPAKIPRTFVAIFTVFASIHKQTRILSNIVQIVSYRFENLWNRARKQLSHYFFNTTAILISWLWGTGSKITQAKNGFNFDRWDRSIQCNIRSVVRSHAYFPEWKPALSLF